MNNIRPLTAPKENKSSKELKLLIPGFRRPASAKTHSLKQIIQVIENTLNKGAQTLLTKSKTLDRFSKFKQQFEKSRKQSSKNTTQKEFPVFKTEFLIGNSAEFQRALQSPKSTKFIKNSHDNCEFQPYHKESLPPEDAIFPKESEKEQIKKKVIQKTGIRKL